MVQDRTRPSAPSQTPTESTVGTADAALQAGAGAQTEARLRESEERFRGAFEHATIGMALVAPDGRWLCVNQALCRIVGYSAEELLATNFQSITHPDDLEADISFVRQMLDGSIPHYDVEKRYFHKGGHIIWILLSVSLVRDEAGKPLCFVSQIQDITARKDAESRLRDSELRYRTIAALMPGFVYEGTLVDAHPRAIWASEGFERLYGCDIDTFNRLGHEHFFEPAVSNYMLSMTPALARGRDVSVEIPMRSLNGTQHWLRIVARMAGKGPGGEHERVVGVAEDITERKRVEKALEDVSLREQLRLGRDIHDGLGQELTGLAYLASSVAQEAERSSSALAGDLRTLATMAHEAVVSCRDIARGVSPLTESRGSLIASLRKLVDQLSSVGPTHVHFDAHELAPLTLRWEARNHLYRIAQEALSNALRHAQAQHVFMTIDIAPDLVSLAVADDGCGIATQAALSPGIGLDSMRQRAASIGARFSVREARPHGTVITCECAQPDRAELA